MTKMTNDTKIMLEAWKYRLQAKLAKAEEKLVEVQEQIDNHEGRLKRVEDIVDKKKTVAHTDN